MFGTGEQTVGQFERCQVPPGDLAAVVAAGGVQWTVNTALVGAVIAWTVTIEHPRQVLGSASDNLLEVAQLALGVFVALALLMIVPTFACTSASSSTSTSWPPVPTSAPGCSTPSPGTSRPGMLWNGPRPRRPGLAS
ncbi:hypothetical protein OG738_29515 [Amycolatopsis sp. NBC_01488]|uniref:hypothetical protein n=1 Tax=Amycolatopsis sp. NBC_01488 TaxID=2903563 RepID=UPI002E2DACA6|nr:hypothetical protein [Amycolatopsis sp. NBC_01488]